MLVCQITDLRVKPRGALAYRVVDTAAYLRRCIAHILAQPQRPDVVVATGDLPDSAVAATSPSPAHQVALDLEPDAASQFLLEPPAYRLHWWHESSGVVTHTAFIGDFAGPYRFHEGEALVD